MSLLPERNTPAEKGEERSGRNRDDGCCCKEIRRRTSSPDVHAKKNFRAADTLCVGPEVLPTPRAQLIFPRIRGVSRLQSSLFYQTPPFRYNSAPFTRHRRRGPSACFRAHGRLCQTAPIAQLPRSDQTRWISALHSMALLCPI